jgi:hypothetical protein
LEELTRGAGLWRLTFLVKEGKRAKGNGEHNTLISFHENRR